MRRSLRTLMAFVAWMPFTAGCGANPSPIRTLKHWSFCQGMKPLRPGELNALHWPDSLPGLFPHGPSTPVSIIGSPDHPGVPIGVSFPVHRAVAYFTLHATRRELRFLVGSSGSKAPTVVLVPSPVTSEACVSILTAATSDDALFRLNGIERDAEQRSKLVALLNHWQDSADAEPSEIAKTWVDIELGKTPGDSESSCSDADGSKKPDEGTVGTQWRSQPMRLPL